MTEFVGDLAGDHLREAGDRVSDAFDDAESRRGNPEHGQEARQDDCARLVAEVAEGAGQAGADHCAIEPTLGSALELASGDVFRRAILALTHI